MKLKTIGLIVLMAFLTAGIVIGILFFNKNGSQRKPKDGFYPSNHRAYYAFSQNEEPIINLETFFVNNAFRTNPDRVTSYSDFALIDSEANTELPFTLREEDLAALKSADGLVFQDVDTVFDRMLQIPVVNVALSERAINFTQLRYKDPDGNQVVKEIGCITVEGGYPESKEAAAMSARLQWEKYEQPTFDQLEYIFSSGGKAVQIRSVSFGQTGVEPEITFPVQVAANDEITETYPVHLNKDVADEPMFYALKPKFEYETDGEIFTGTFGNTELEKYIAYDIDILEYLYQRSEKEKNL